MRAIREHHDEASLRGRVAGPPLPTPFTRLVFDALSREHLYTYSSLHQLALDIGSHPGTVYDWFRRGARPRASTLPALATRLKIPLEALYTAAGYDAVGLPAWDPSDYVSQLRSAILSVPAPRRVTKGLLDTLSVLTGQSELRIDMAYQVSYRAKRGVRDPHPERHNRPPLAVKHHSDPARPARSAG